MIHEESCYKRLLKAAEPSGDSMSIGKTVKANFPEVLGDKLMKAAGYFVSPTSKIWVQFRKDGKIGSVTRKKQTVEGWHEFSIV